MLAVLFLIFLVLGFACFVAATFGAGTRWNLMAAGLAFWILVPLINQFRALT
jgi:uncharacterized membrane protein YqjE